MFITLLESAFVQILFLNSISQTQLICSCWHWNLIMHHSFIVISTLIDFAGLYFPSIEIIFFHLWSTFSYILASAIVHPLVCLSFPDSSINFLLIYYDLWFKNHMSLRVRWKIEEIGKCSESFLPSMWYHKINDIIGRNIRKVYIVEICGQV